jgi:ABC-type Fe3+-siderophore transport system permease subunit
VAFLAAAAPYITAGATALSVYSQAQQGSAQQAQMNILAAQREKAANQALVESQAEAANERRKSKYLRSRAQAVAGKSGTDVSSPGISNILTGIETEGEMNALTSLHSGEYLARGLRTGAAVARNQGAAARTAGYMGAATTALSGTVGFYEKYGGE